MSSFLYTPAHEQVPPSLQDQQVRDQAESRESAAPRNSGSSSGRSSNPRFKDQARSIPLAEATPVEADVAVVENERNVDVSQRRRLLELEERQLRLDRERFEFEHPQKATLQTNRQLNGPRPQTPRATNGSNQAQGNRESMTNAARWKPSSKLEGIIRWTILGLTILSWVLVIGFLASRDSDAIFGSLLFLTLSMALVSVALVICLLPNTHAVRAWWSARSLFCVALFCAFLSYILTFSGIGIALNSINVIILIVLITLSFWIAVPEKPIFDAFNKDARTSAAAPPNASAQGPGRLDHYEDDKPIVVAAASEEPTETTRTENVIPEGHQVRETAVYPDGRKEVTETIEEPSTIVQQPDQTFVSLQETATYDGNRVVVETTKHSDGRQEIVEVVEEPSMIGAHVKDASSEVNRGAGQSFDEENPMPPSIYNTPPQSRDPSFIGEGPVVSKETDLVDNEKVAPSRRRQLDPPEN